MSLEILLPGCVQIRLAPVRIDFDYDATFPTPKGLMRVTHKQGKFEMKVPAEVKIIS